MKKPYKNISEFTVKKSKVVILGITFMLSSVSVDAASSILEKEGQAAAVTAAYAQESNQENWQTVLDELAEYPDNWDAEGAKAISPATIANCRSLLKQTAQYVAILDDIFPTELGTVCIQWYDETSNALINTEISSDRMAFYADVPGREFVDFKPAPYGKESIDKLVDVLDSVS